MTRFPSRVMITILLLFGTTAWAEIRYVTDQFEITMRTGTSTSNNILAMLRSGQKVTVIEQDVATRYSLVETDDGKKGYVLSRFLDSEPSGRERFDKLQIDNEHQKIAISELENELENYRQSKLIDNEKNEELESNLNQTADELERLKLATQDTILVIQQNKKLNALITELEKEKRKLSEENADYKDSTAMDWFVRGASVSLIAFLLGILITRIRWKKRDSWGGSY